MHPTLAPHVGGAAGYRLERRLIGTPGRVAPAARLAVLVFTLATLPFMDFLNACLVGHSVLFATAGC